MIKGFAKADEKERRLKICGGCPQIFKPTYTCKVCGCFMNAKAALANSKCPKGKW